MPTAATALRAPVHAPVPRIRGVGVITGWGEGVDALPAEAPAGGAGLVTVPTPVLGGDRFRRATRECVLAVAAAKAAVADAGLSEAEISGPRTSILYVSVTGYAAANRAFLEDETSTTLHFPYTSPSAVPGEVTIELGVRGPYVNLMGGGPSTFQALGWAASWLAEGRADRVLLLAVEAFHDVRDLFGRARRLYAGPLIEGAVCVLLEAGSGDEGALRWASVLAGSSGSSRSVSAVLDEALAGARPCFVWSAAAGAGRDRAEARILADRGARATASRLGEALAMGPLLAIARARRDGAAAPWLLTATWRDEYAALLWGL
jgi:Beta-ketoacyl synthase, N-terminal domain